jgi:hypothetical protein
MRLGINLNLCFPLVARLNRVHLTNRWTSRLEICLDRPNFVLIVGVVPADAAALVNSMLDVQKFVNELVEEVA